MKTAIGVDIGGTKILTALVDECGHVLESVQVDSDTRDKETMFRSVVKSIEQLFDLCNINKLSSPIGVGVPGLVDNVNGVAVYQSNIPWENFPIKERLKNSFETNGILVDNDVVMAGYRAYSTYGNNDLITYITVSTGIACTSVMKGEIIRGNGFSGEIGHFMVKNNQSYERLEKLTAGPGIRNRAREMYKDDSLYTKDVFERYYQNEDIATKILEDASEVFAQNLYSLIALIDPKKIIFGGSVIVNNPQYLELIKDKLKLFMLKNHEHILDSMYITEDNGRQGVIGAALKAMHNQEKM